MAPIGRTNWPWFPILAAALLAGPAAEARRFHAGICLFALADVSQPPRFEDYPAPRRTVTRPAAPVLSSPDARLFRTRLRRGAESGPSFAGNYTVAAWGCGSSCLSFAIIDARSGQVHLAGLLSHIHVDQQEAILFRADSRLLIVLGMPDEDEQRDGAHFYEWTGRSLHLRRFVPARQLCR